MDVTTLFIIGLVSVLVVSILTPAGRNGWRKLGGTIGALVGIAGDSSQTARIQQQQLRAEVDDSTQKSLAEVQRAYAAASLVISEHKKLVAEKTKWEGNRDRAAAEYRRLTTDDVADTEQERSIGTVRNIGDTAMQHIASLQASIDANASNVQAAQETLSKAERFFQTIPERAAAMVRAGNIAAATREMSTASARVNNAASTFSNSPAARILEDMQRSASTAQAESAAAEARATASPVSADIAAQQLGELSGGSFLDFVAEKDAPAVAPKA